MMLTKLLSKKLLVLVSYLIISLIITLNHEIWKDEAHHWLLGRDSANFFELISNSRYEGHPLLWNYCLFLISFISHNVILMQLLHWTIASVNVWLILYKSRFPESIKFILPFTYFFLYEYQAISRNYSLCMLFAFFIAYFLTKKDLQLTIIGVLLALLANTHLFGLVFASGLFLVITYEIYRRNNQRITTAQYIPFVIICLAAFLLSVIQIIPPDDHFLTVNHNNAGWFSERRLNKLLTIIYRGVVHFPSILEEHPWNQNFLFRYIPNWLKGIISLISWVIPAFLFFRKKYLLFLFYFTAVSISLFSYISPLHMAVRHCGFIFIVLLTLLWLKDSAFSQKSGTNPCLHYFRKPLFLLLLLQSVAAFYMSLMDFKRPFSQAQNVANFLNEMNKKQLPIISTQNNGQSLSAYLQMQVYYADREEYGSFAIWNTSSFILDNEQIISNIQLFSETHDEFLIVTHLPFQHDLLGDDWEVDDLKSFQGSIVLSENFYVISCKKRY